MGGVGKTTIMQHINNRLLEDTCNFDGVLWVTVSKQFSLLTLQKDIAKSLAFELSDEEDETRSASELYAMLSLRKKYVLILDDLWEAFPLEKVGIPEPTRSNGCKLVLTTQSLEVCRRMECRIIKVNLLAEKKALNLFLSKAVENDTVLHPEVKEIAIKVAKECACLPLAIMTVAGSMRGVNDIREWRNALNELKDVGDGETEVFERLKFSYSRLQDEVHKHCFLYCALYPEDRDIPMRKLIKYWIAEGLIADMNSEQAMFDKGHAILGKLINTCLLSNTQRYGEECVKMHDLLRDMALRITARSPKFMVKAGTGLKRVSYEDWSGDLERVSLMYNMIGELPTRPPNCPRLTTLLLGHNNRALVVIPENFFMHMHRLKVLDLSCSFLRCLPESISNLKNLHSLLLEDCEQLSYVPSLEKLKALKELKLNRSLIREVPQGIEELVNLRRLDFSFNERLEIFPSWKLCRLSQLQFLGLDETGVQVSADELLCLRELEVLGAHFPNIQEFTRYATSLQCQGLKTYRLLVGRGHFTLTNEEKEASIKIDPELLVSRVDLLVLPNNIKLLTLEECHTLNSLSDIMSLRYAIDLKRIAVRDCNGIESIFSSALFLEDNLFPLRTVTHLNLYDLPSFRVLFDRIVPPHNISFNLTELKFHRCPRMKSIFPAKLLQNFPNFKELEVFDCEHLVDIIVESEMRELGHHQGCFTITLPNLWNLNLKGLPRLRDIYKGITVCESLQVLRVSECPMLWRLPPLTLEASAPPTLKLIQGEKEWWESLGWDDPRTKTILQPFFNHRGIPWTEEEHRSFLLGLRKVGKGNWRGISRNFVKTRTPRQVASHAQKYFLRRSNLIRHRRQYSLFDITAESLIGIKYHSLEFHQTT